MPFITPMFVLVAEATIALERRRRGALWSPAPHLFVHVMIEIGSLPEANGRSRDDPRRTDTAVSGSPFGSAAGVDATTYHLATSAFTMEGGALPNWFAEEAA